MKKLFPLEITGHKAPRVIELIKRDVNKYVKRERRKELPDDVDFWDFDCRVGTGSGRAEPVHISKISAAIDQAAQQDGDSIYVEILAKPGRRTPNPDKPEKAPATPPAEASSDWGDT